MKTSSLPSADSAHDSTPHNGRLPEHLIDAAISWALKLDYNLPAPATRLAFEQWLHADPAHELAWQRVHSLKGLKQGSANIPSALARDTLQAMDARRQLRGRRNALKLLSLGSVALVTGWIAREHTPWQRLVADASTATGEQRTLRLSDGTVLVLNTDSAVGIQLEGERRLIVLRRGEILVTTGADSVGSSQWGTKRPFWVSTPFGQLHALGTRFVVRLDQQRARIGVQEGAVELHPSSGGSTVIVRPGESRWLTVGGTAPAETQGFADDAWADGVIAGKNMRLADLIAELSRYRMGRIVCDPRVADLRVSGVFHVRDTDQALQFLAQTQPLSLSYRTRYWVTLVPKEAGWQN